jgi:hypothetical protein
MHRSSSAAVDSCELGPDAGLLLVNCAEKMKTLKAKY